MTVCVQLHVNLAVTDFSVSDASLKEGFVQLVSSHALPGLELQRDALMSSVASLVASLHETESKMLDCLSRELGEGVLEDMDLIRTVEACHTTTIQVAQQLRDTEANTDQLNALRAAFQPFAAFCTSLYSAVEGLVRLNRMYAYPLEWFQWLTMEAMELPDGCDVTVSDVPFLGPLLAQWSAAHPQLDATILEQLGMGLANLLVSSVRTVCAGLASEHRPLFGVAVLAAVDCFAASAFSPESVASPTTALWDFIRGLSSAAPLGPIPDHVPPGIWTDLVHVYKTGLGLEPADACARVLELISGWSDSTTALVDPVWTTESDLLKLCVLKILHPTRFMSACAAYAFRVCGPVTSAAITNNIQVSLRDMYSHTSPKRPLLFVLSTGVDPLVEVTSFAEAEGMSGTFQVISLGRGQGSFAAKTVRQAAKHGSWVLLMNVHLFPSWFNGLEALFEEVTAGSPHSNFRLILTSASIVDFPLNVLQASVKFIMQRTLNAHASVQVCS